MPVHLNKSLCRPNRMLRCISTKIDHFMMILKTTSLIEHPHENAGDLCLIEDKNYLRHQSSKEKYAQAGW
jgi:hypothetical protein